MYSLYMPLTDVQNKNKQTKKKQKTNQKQNEKASWGY